MHIQRKPVHNIKDLIESADLFRTFSDYEIYIWSSFPFKTDSDVDIIFVGEVTETLGKRLHELSEKINLDITVLPTTRIFSYIPDFNKATFRYYFPEKIIRYKLCPMNRDEWDNGWKCTKHSEYLWKIDQTFARKDTKYKTRKWHYPMLFIDFIKLYENIKNED
jgi:predicted nucleotidyltransferase